MCAIGGEIDYSEKLSVCDYHRQMLSTMNRRGPDSDGVYCDNNAVLLHARLAVIDVQNGRQPMTAQCGDDEYTIVYNGEIYNTDELRQLLIKNGVRLRTKSDTEVVLMLYTLYGEDCVSMLNGIFAFGIWDKKAGRLFVARDRIGYLWQETKYV